jgi:hypothetical protein
MFERHDQKLVIFTFVGVLDTRVSRSTCSWAPSSAHLPPRGESTIQATEKTLTRRRLVRRMTTETAKDQKTSSRAPAGEERRCAHVSSARLRAEQEDNGRRPRTAHATPDREETNFRCACIKWHSGCWPPPLNIAWTVQGARRGCQLPPPTPVDRRHYPTKTKSTEEFSLQLSTLLGRVCGNPFPKKIRGRRTLAL